MKNTLLLLILFFPIILNAQNFEWAKHLSGNLSYPSQVTADDQNNSYVVGTYRGLVDFDPNTGVNNNSNVYGGGYIVKLNSYGELVWANKLQCLDSAGLASCSSIYIEDNTYLYVIGNFKKTVDFNNGNISNTISSTTDDKYNSFILKYDLTGTMIWSKFLKGNGNIFTNEIAVSNNRIYLCGSFHGNIDFNPSINNNNNYSSTYNSSSFILQLDYSGNLVWYKRNTTNNIFSRTNHYDLNIDSFGNIFTVGSVNGSVNIEDTTLNTYPWNGTSTHNFYTDVIIEKYDTNGIFNWVKRFDGELDEFMPSIASDTKGNIYTTGDHSYGIDFDPNEGEQLMSSYGNYDNYVLKLDSLGQFIWVKPFGLYGQIGSRIVADKHNNIYTIGMFSDEFDIDPGPGVQLIENGGHYNFFIQKLDESGNFVWGKGIQSIPIANHGFSDYSIFVNDNLNVFTSGGFKDSIDLNPDIGEAYLVSGIPNIYNSFIQKFNQCTPTFGIDSQTACFTYTWINDSTYTHNINSEVYTLVGQSATGCDSIVTLNLVIDTVNTNITTSNSVLSSNTDQATYQWYDCKNNVIIETETYQTYSPIINGNYGVIIEENNCIDTSDCVLIDDLIESYSSGIGVPQAFSPNEDGNNDILFVKGNGINELTFSIYNRYGELVFNSTSQNTGWDGNFKGKKENPGVFVWLLECKFIDGSILNNTGNVTLLR